MARRAGGEIRQRVFAPGIGIAEDEATRATAFHPIMLGPRKPFAHAGGEALLFGRTSERPFNASNLGRRADRAWKRAGLDRITLHECRHTFASLMIAAGVNAQALSTYMGHASIWITLDRYGHLMPGSEDEPRVCSTPT